MGEIAINPIHNVHKKYRKVNLVNPYTFVLPIDLSTNTVIGGVSATISTPALLATKLGISVGNISNFTIVGSDIKCKITGTYNNTTFFDGGTNNSAVTYFTDSDGLINDVGYVRNYPNLTSYYHPNGNIISQVDYGKLCPLLKLAYFPNATTMPSNCFNNANGLEEVYIPNVITLGATTGDNACMYFTKYSVKLYLNPVLATCNGGNPDGDIVWMTTNRAAITRYVTNFTAPTTPILSIGTVYSTAIQITDSASASTNAIDYYDIYLGGVYSGKSSSGYIMGLTASTSYNITVVAVDIFRNKSIVSNSVTQSTNTTSAVPTTGLVSYYKLDGNSNDSFGANNGTDTSMSYVSGKVGSAGSFNGSSSYISLGNPANLQISVGTVCCWVKASASGSSFRGIIGKQLGYMMFLADGVLGVYSWGSPSGFKTTGINLNDGLWHYVSFVFNSGTANNYLYIDGVLKLTFSWSISSQGTAATIGSGGGSSQIINALIDEAPIHNVNLTQTQINLLYNNGNGITL